MPPLPEVEELERQRREHEHRQLEIALAYQVAFAGETGRVVLEDLAGKCWAHASMLGADENGRIDELQLACREGQRMAYLEIQRMIALASVARERAAEKRPDQADMGDQT